MREINKKRQKNNIFYSLKTTGLLLVINIMVIAVLLVLMNVSTTKTTSVSNNISKLSDLNIENQMLQKNISDLQSVDMLKEKANKLGMVNPTDITYINNTDSISYNLH